MRDQKTGMITEVEVEGVGMVRLPNMWQWVGIKRVRVADRQIAQLAASCCMTIKQFKELPLEKQREVWDAYLALISPTNMGTFDHPANEPAKFEKGIHRTEAEKIAIGRKLIEVKAELPRGHFGPWLEEQGIPGSFAHQAMRLAKAA